MTDEEVDRISRSWVGHIGTSMVVREAMLLVGSNNAALAALINETVVPKNDVQPEDIPAIQACVAVMFVESEQPDPDDGQGILQYTGPPGH